MKKSLIFTLIVCFLMSLNILFLPFESEARNVERVSVDNSGDEGDGSSSYPSINSGGRYVAFQSNATNLVTGDINGSRDVFVYDRDTGEIERISVDNSGVQGDGSSGSPSISSDGRYVAFQSNATNLVTGDINGSRDVFVYDRDTDEVERVSVNNLGVQGDSNSEEPSISSDGRYVAFYSNATNLVAGDTNSRYDVFVYDRNTHTAERVSLNNSSVQGDGSSNYPSISSDGLYVTFQSSATNLVTGDTNGSQDVFVYDRDTDTIERVSIDNSGVEGNGGSSYPSISSDGRNVAFRSYATNLVTGDTNATVDVFVYDRETGKIERVSVDNSGYEGDFASYAPSISSNDHYVAFYSDATNLVTGDTNTTADVFVSYTVPDTSSPPGGGGSSGGCFISTCSTLE